MKFTGGQKIIHCNHADIHLHYANNRGRGSNNVTVSIVPIGTNRKQFSREYPIEISQYRISGWRGIVNIPSTDIEKCGGIKTE